jgi:hypothetical protein
MEQSILLSTKKILGIGPDDDSFDLDVLTFINTAFSTLNDVGVGVDGGFLLQDAEYEWDDFAGVAIIDDTQINDIKTYVFLRVRMLFDPPGTPYLINAFEEQLKEHIVRISSRREATDWVDPDPPVVVEDA